MTCLNDSEIQAVADNESAPDRAAHAAGCVRCGARVTEYRRRVEAARQALAGGATLPDGVAQRVEAAILSGHRGQGATRLRDSATRRPRWQLAGWSAATAVAAAVVLFVFVVPAIRGPQTVSAAEILAKSVTTLSAAPDGIEIREYELVVDGMPRELLANYADGTYRIRQAIDHRTKGRFRFASYTADGRLLTSIAQDPIARRRTSLFRVDDRYYRFEFSMPSSDIPSLPELERLHMEMSVTMMQASGQHLLQTVQNSAGTFYLIEVPQVNTTNLNAVWDLTHARVLIDADNYKIHEFSASGTFMKQPYSVSYKLISSSIGAKITPDPFEIPAQPDELVISGEGTANPAADALLGSLRELARLKGVR
jgi:hypothetical protein